MDTALTAKWILKFRLNINFGGPLNFYGFMYMTSSGTQTTENILTKFTSNLHFGANYVHEK